MKLPAIAAAAALATLSLSVAGAAEARGCIKGAIVGGVAGHFAGRHATVGALGGCAVGHHLAHRNDRRDYRRGYHAAPAYRRSGRSAAPHPTPVIPDGVSRSGTQGCFQHRRTRGCRSGSRIASRPG